MVNKENVSKVTAALVSNQYPHGFGKLRKKVDGETRYCPLGVACDVSGLGFWRNDAYIVNGKSSILGLPEEVADWLGFDWLFGPGIYGFPSSSKANDSQELTVQEIAVAWNALASDSPPPCSCPDLQSGMPCECVIMSRREWVEHYTRSSQASR